jgi:hypothetical protein
VASTQVSAENSKKICVTRHTYKSSFEMGMNRQLKRSTELDRIADSLLKSSALRHEEIEEIVDCKDLFSSVKRRVIAESENGRQTASVTSSIFRPRALSFAALAVIALITVISAVQAIVNRNKDSRKAVPGIVRTKESPIQHEEQPNFARPTPQQDEKGPGIEQAVYKPRPDKPLIRTPRPTKNATPDEQPLEFYALADMNSAEPVTGGRVVRVDLPRASLVSLGVNVPLGSDKQLIKADLLVGPDGVPRAIRLVE